MNKVQSFYKSQAGMYTVIAVGFLCIVTMIAFKTAAPFAIMTIAFMLQATK